MSDISLLRMTFVILRLLVDFLDQISPDFSSAQRFSFAPEREWSFLRHCGDDRSVSLIGVNKVNYVARVSNRTRPFTPGINPARPRRKRVYRILMYVYL